jgi:actin-like ATPase involved in cell morphogenesis
MPREATVGYSLGVDLGTTFTAAALSRNAAPEIVMLGGRASVVPSVLWLAEDGQVLVGESAERHVITDPSRVAREFKRRIGDPTALLIGGAPYSAESLMGRLLRWVVESVTRSEGSAPERVAVSFPANWGPYKRELLDQTIKLADLGQAVTITEPVAAASYYASAEKLAEDEVIAAYDLGGGTFDAAVLRRTASGFDILGTPEGIERLGGVDFDKAVFDYIVQMSGDPLAELDPADPSTLAAVQRLHEEAVRAKESLSVETDVTVPVLLPNRNTQVRLTRAEFEEMIRPRLADTIGALRRSLKSADVEPGHLKGVLLVGGSSRIPLVAQTVSAALGRPVAVDAHPKNVVALGAALAARAASVATDVPLPAAASAASAASATSATANVDIHISLGEQRDGDGDTAELVGAALSAPVKAARLLRTRAVVPFLLGLAGIGVGAYFLLGHHSSNNVAGSLSSSRHGAQQQTGSGSQQHANGASPGGSSTGAGSTGGVLQPTGGGHSGVVTQPAGGGPTSPALPKVTAVNPSCASEASGDQVTITGSGFTGATAVKFASAQANATVHSDAWITATSPSGVTGTVDVTVSGPGGTSATSSSDLFIYPTIPSITGVTPNNETNIFQQALTITGGGFTCATSVYFGNLIGLNMQVNNDGSITVTPPPPPAYATLPYVVDVTVNGAGGMSTTSSSAFTYTGQFHA